MGILFLSIGINLLLIVLVYLGARRRINRLLSGGEALDEIKDEINRLVVELNQTSDRNIGIIEERIQRLRDLINEADKKIMLLGKESEKVRIGTDVYAKLKKSKSLVPDHQSAPPSGAAAVDSPVENRPQLSEAREDAVEFVKSKVIDEVSVGEAESSPAERVLALYRQGFDPKIIASKTGSPLGEIELIISLSDGTGQ